MRHFHRTALAPSDVVETADHYFPAIGLTRTGGDARSRAFTGTLGALTVRVRMEGGHYTLIDVFTDQMGESRLDRNVKNFFSTLHRMADPRHRIEAAY